MRHLLAPLMFAVGLCAAADVRAQNVSDPATALVDCATDSVATNVEGDAVPAAARPLHAEPQNVPVLDLCRDANDPRCAPVTPLGSPHGSFVSADVQRFLGALGLSIPAATFVVLPVPTPIDASITRGPSGVLSSVDRPPR